VITLFKLLSALPLGLLHGLGAVFGWLAYGLSGRYRREFQANAAQAGVSMRMARPGIAHAGRMVMELPYLWFRPPARSVLRDTPVENIHLVEQAVAAKRGILFLTPHLGCFEITAQSWAVRYGSKVGPITCLYRPPRHPSLQPLVESARKRDGLDAAPATLSGVRQMIRALRRGEAVGLLPDQVPPEGLGVWAPFFGKPAYTMTLAARLAQQTNAAIILAWGERLPFGQGYIVHLDELSEPLSTDADTSAAQVNAAMQALILRCPGQYLWGYERYKKPRADSPLQPNAASPEAPDGQRP
jgi:Kdo2-lipid IVA lauroyltransferase/acyltransferase